MAERETLNSGFKVYMWLYHRKTETISSRCCSRFLLSYWIVVWFAVRTLASCCRASFSGCLHASVCKRRGLHFHPPPVAVQYSKNGKHRPNWTEQIYLSKEPSPGRPHACLQKQKRFLPLLLLRWTAKNLCRLQSRNVNLQQSEDLTKAIRFIFHFPSRHDGKSSGRLWESGSVMEID